MSRITNDRLTPVWHRMLYSCIHTATVGVKGLNELIWRSVNRTCRHTDILTSSSTVMHWNVWTRTKANQAWNTLNHAIRQVKRTEDDVNSSTRSYIYWPLGHWQYNQSNVYTRPTRHNHGYFGGRWFSQPITWLILTNKTVQENTQTKYSSKKANNTKHSRTKLSWFSRLLQHSARKRGALILQCYQAHKEQQGNYTVFRKKHPLTFSFISPWVMREFKQKLQWIYLGNGEFWQCRN